tara:strand:- start:8 stop:466 length:459 start_codon:yes stop_codon:yes gene_type:complete
MVSLMGFISIFISIIISLNYSYILSNFLIECFPNTEKLLLGFASIIFTFFISSFFIHQISTGIKNILDMTLIGVIDDISGAFFGFITTALIISFIINIFQYFDISILEKEIKESTISFYLFDFAPNTFAYFIDFFPSLEFIIENDESNKLTS